MALRDADILMIEVVDPGMVPVIGLLEEKLSKKGFSIQIGLEEGDIVISVSHKWLIPVPIVLLRVGLVEEIIKPLGFKIKKWLHVFGKKKFTICKHDT